MPRIDATPDLLEEILARIPEGFIHKSTLGSKISTKKRNTTAVEEAVESGKIGETHQYYFDPERIQPAEVDQLALWCRPVLPTITRQGALLDASIEERLREREDNLPEYLDPATQVIIDKLKSSPGYMHTDELCSTPDDLLNLHDLLDIGYFQQYEDYVYDPLRVSESTMRTLSHNLNTMHLRADLNAILEARPGGTVPRDELAETFGKETLNSVISSGGYATFNVPIKKRPYQQVWVRLTSVPQDEALAVAREAVKIRDEDWEETLEQTGEALRPGARDGKNRRARVVARSYTIKSASRRLGVHQKTMESAAEAGVIASFIDPEERLRFPADEVEAAYEDHDYRLQITAHETIQTRDLAIVTNLSYPAMRRRLAKANISRSKPQWGQVRGRWKLPETLNEFRATLRERKIELEAERERQREEELERQRLEKEAEKREREEERRRREALRTRLVEAFPTWRHDGRIDQRIMLHVGPPNSGKTYDSLQTLKQSQSGWYLAPLRLLAFEVFDRLNRDGVYCNLLTGEERIDVPGANITAATIEMFNPKESGDCIIIDEAQMLADADRGWAWTQALMTAQAPIIHVIGPLTARDLIVRLADEAGLPLTVVEHERLTPLRVAERNWPLHEIPPRTILVAFSRWMVLHLKTELERVRRTVSVVYGSLPPEVRRKQADRFADGETEICVATDAVGMGLNLPADNVCFYEVEKFDGRRRRMLLPTEVHQIGGRAGRYGLSQAGEIGATNKQNLRIIHELYEQQPVELTHARVAPSVEDLQMIPGSLWERLKQWASLQSIPDSLHSAIKTADMTERIELARMLSDEEVDYLGMATALRLVNAPTRQSSRMYWYQCAQGIINNYAMALPAMAPEKIQSSDDLEETEHCISCADIYLWLASRHEFAQFGEDEPHVRWLRGQWSNRIDQALLLKLDTSRRCPECGRQLALGYRYRLCDDCYYRRRDDNGRY